MEGAQPIYKAPQYPPLLYFLLHKRNDALQRSFILAALLYVDALHLHSSLRLFL